MSSKHVDAAQLGMPPMAGGKVQQSNNNPVPTQQSLEKIESEINRMLSNGMSRNAIPLIQWLLTSQVQLPGAKHPSTLVLSVSPVLLPQPQQGACSSLEEDLSQITESDLHFHLTTVRYLLYLAKAQRDVAENDTALHTVQYILEMLSVLQTEFCCKNETRTSQQLLDGSNTLEAELHHATRMSLIVPIQRQATVLAMQCCFALSSWRQSVTYAETVLRDFDPNCVPALYVLGRCAEMVGNPQGSVLYYKKCLQVDPLYSAAFAALSEHFLLTREELLKLVDEELVFPAEFSALKEMYRQRVSPSTSSVQLFSSSTSAALQAPPGVPQSVIQLRSAESAYYAHRLEPALQQTVPLVESNPFHRDYTCLHLSILVDLRAASKLYQFAQKLVSFRPKHYLSLYAVGCYYFTSGNFEKAGKFFCRASELDVTFAHALVAYGHCYAKLEEGEQALAAYRKALSTFPGLTCCSAFLGMQYLRSSNYSEAHHCLEYAKALAPTDPLILNEIGVLCVRTGKLTKALQYFKEAWDMLPNKQFPSEYHDCIPFNIATCYRKLKHYEQALDFYSLFVRLKPFATQGHMALGLTHHIIGNAKMAIHHYHSALALKNDVFCRDLLERALSEEYSRGVGGEGWGVDPQHGSTSSNAERTTGLYELSPSPANIALSHNVAGGTLFGGPGRDSYGSCPNVTDPSPHPSFSTSVGRTLTY